MPCWNDKYLKTVRILHVYHAAYAGYYYRYSKYSSTHSFNLEEHDEKILLDCFKDYDWVHFWSEVKPSTIRGMFQTKDRPIISMTNPFGEPIFPNKEKPFDIQFHVSTQAMQKYFR